ncbi:hypothetical protein GJAV_G00221080 [Gymnothorax javanicus]|nr:hypothetical protein GJAV_G00221080 [Gymnothorax javanicus]
MYFFKINVHEIIIEDQPLLFLLQAIKKYFGKLRSTNPQPVSTFQWPFLSDKEPPPSPTLDPFLELRIRSAFHGDHSAPIYY